MATSPPASPDKSDSVLGKCPDRFCENGGECSVGCDGRPKCRCPAGFLGPKCAKTECPDNFCENGGECLLTSLFDKVCKCRNGFYGERCRISPCSVDTCLNNG